MPSIALPHRLDHIFAEVGFIGHGQKYTADFQLGMDLPLDLLHRTHKLRHILSGQVIRLMFMIH